VLGRKSAEGALKNSNGMQAKAKAISSTERNVVLSSGRASGRKLENTVYDKTCQYSLC
jgi:hypothetical protein